MNGINTSTDGAKPSVRAPHLIQPPATFSPKRRRNANGTRKAMSLAKLAANRRNAQKSTGPKTPAGKAVAKMNALKHGLLAKTLVVRGHQIKESTNELKKMCREFYADLNPVGPVEEMLVDQIISLTWRLRRARAAESGEIALSVDGGHWQREKHNPLPLILNWPRTEFSDPLAAHLQQSALGCHYLIHCLKDVRQAVERDGELTEPMLIEFKKWLRGQADDMGDKLEQFRLWLVANPEKLEPAALRARHSDEVLKYLDQKIRTLNYWMERRKEREDAEAQARESAAMLPPAETLDKILRYETTLLRQLHQAMHQLERLQRRRSGENIPPPLAVDVSAKP